MKVLGKFELTNKDTSSGIFYDLGFIIKLRLAYRLIDFLKTCRRERWSSSAFSLYVFVLVYSKGESLDK